MFPKIGVGLPKSSHFNRVFHDIFTIHFGGNGPTPILRNIHISWIYPPPSNSHHQDYEPFLVGIPENLHLCDSSPGWGVDPTYMVVSILGARTPQPTESSQKSRGFVEFGCPDISATHRWLSKYCVTQPNFEIQLTGKMFLFFRYIYIYI